jgi:hypothetical protein
MKANMKLGKGVTFYQVDMNENLRMISGKV